MPRLEQGERKPMKLEYQQTIISALCLVTLEQATGCKARRVRLEAFIEDAILRRWPDQRQQQALLQAHISVVLDEAVHAGQLVAEADCVRLAQRMRTPAFREAAGATLHEAGLRVVIRRRGRGQA